MELHENKKDTGDDDDDDNIIIVAIIKLTPQLFFIMKEKPCIGVSSIIYTSIINY